MADVDACIDSSVFGWFFEQVQFFVCRHCGQFIVYVAEVRERSFQYGIYCPIFKVDGNYTLAGNSGIQNVVEEDEFVDGVCGQSCPIVHIQ